MAIECDGPIRPTLDEGKAGTDAVGERWHHQEAIKVNEEDEEDEEGVLPPLNDVVNYDGSVPKFNKNHRKLSKKSQQSDPVSEDTVALSMSDTEATFAFDINLPPPEDVSPLSCKESVVTAMLARHIDRALEHAAPARPPMDDMGHEGPSSSQKRRSHDRHHHHHRDSQSRHRRHDDEKREKRPRSTSHLLRTSTHSSTRHTTSDNRDSTHRRRHRSTSEKPSSRHTSPTDETGGTSSRRTSSRSRSRDITSGHRYRSISKSSSRRRDHQHKDEETESGRTNTEPIQEKEIDESQARDSSVPQPRVDRSSLTVTGNQSKSSTRSLRSLSRSNTSKSGPRSPSLSSHRRTGATEGSAMRNPTRKSSGRSSSRPRSPSQSSSSMKPRSEPNLKTPSSPTRSQSRRRSPSSRRGSGRPTSRPRSPSSSSTNHRRRSPSKDTRGEQEQQLLNGRRRPGRNSSSRSKSRTRERSQSVVRQQPPGQSPREDLTDEVKVPQQEEEEEQQQKEEDGLVYVEPSMKPVILRSTKYSFLSRLEECKGRLSSLSADPLDWIPVITVASAATTIKQNSLDTNEYQKVIRWGGLEEQNREEDQTQDQTEQDVFASNEMVEEKVWIEFSNGLENPVQKDEQKKAPEKDKEKIPPENDKSGSRRRSRSKSLSKRTRSQSRSQRDLNDPTAAKAEKKERKPKWDDLLNRSFSSIRYDDTEVKDKGGCAPTSPVLSPAVEASPSKITNVPVLNDATGPSPQRKYVEKIISETKKKAVDSRMRKLQLNRATDFKETHPEGDVVPDEVVPTEGITTNPLAAMERLRKANLLIQAKKKRREESRARQNHLESYDSTPPTFSMDMIASPLKKFVHAGEANSEIQFIPSLVGSGTLVAAESSFESKETKEWEMNPHGWQMPGGAESQPVSRDEESHIEKNSRWKGVKKGIERISRSNRSLMSNSQRSSRSVMSNSMRSNRSVMSLPIIPEGVPVDLPEEPRGGAKDSHKRLRPSRRERRVEREPRESRISGTTTKTPPTSSKWKELSARAGSTRKPTSSKWSNLKKSLDASAKNFSKDSGLKNSQDATTINVLSSDSNLVKRLDTTLKNVSSDSAEGQHPCSDQSIFDFPTKPSKLRGSAGDHHQDQLEASQEVKAMARKGTSKWGAIGGGVNFIARLKGTITSVEN